MLLLLLLPVFQVRVSAAAEGKGSLTLIAKIQKEGQAVAVANSRWSIYRLANRNSDGSFSLVSGAEELGELMNQPISAKQSRAFLDSLEKEEHLALLSKYGDIVTDQNGTGALQDLVPGIFAVVCLDEKPAESFLAMIPEISENGPEY